MRPISDLACELLKRRPQQTRGIKISTQQERNLTVHTTIISSPATAQQIGKPMGTYVNLAVTHHRPKIITNTLAKHLSTLIKDQQKILVVGLGNSQIVADSLGPQVLRQLVTNEQLLTFEPSIGGITGINSVDAIKAICGLVCPTAVIIIDSLVSAEPSRIGTNYQLCTSGITPGSGIGRDNRPINEALLGVPVIAVGIPVCTILPRPAKQIYHVVPKDIDLIIADCSQIIAGAINTLASQS